jgi:methionyl-tRNA formyltransferase
MKPLRFIFMGTPSFAVSALQALIEAGHEAVCVYTQPPRPSGRGQKLLESPVLQFSKHRGLATETPISLKEPDVIQELLDRTADVIVVAAYGLILPAEIIQPPSARCINIHASLLPRWRGAAPIQRAIMEGDQTTGITIMRMAEGLDTGPIITQKELAIGSDDSGTLHNRLAALGADMVVKCLQKLAAGTLSESPQPAEGITYAHRLNSDEEPIDWRKPANKLLLQIRALSPKPGASFYQSGARWKILSADATTSSTEGVPGQVLDNRLTVACGKGTLRPLTVQRPGKKPMTTSEVLRGTPVPIGTVLS